MDVLSFDLDLNRIHAWSSKSGRVCFDAVEIPYQAILDHDRILIEVYSAVIYGKSPGELQNRFKGAIFNSMVAGRIYQFCLAHGRSDRVLVSPSSRWTLGHVEPVRHQIAGVSGDNHDIRECRAMQFYHKTNPDKWEPFEAYYASISSAQKARKGKAKHEREIIPGRRIS